MIENRDFAVELEIHETRDITDKHVNGALTVIYRDYDNIIENQPRMVYSNLIYPGEIKGPHVHIKRNSYFVCVQGKVIFILKEKNGNYIEIESSEKKPILVKVPKGMASAHLNPTKEVGRIIALADIAWRPNDDEMFNETFDGYDYKKWMINQ